ncbi:MAG: prepilin peptidase [Nanoarchaeota archaeon]
MFEIIFLIFLALIWIIFATIQDLRKREIANWLNFSLIIFALGFRFFYSLFSENFGFFYAGLIGLGIFFILGNLLYYARFFAGGDAKLMIALGAILPFTGSLLSNLKIFSIFLLVFLFVGAVYTILSSVYLSLKNFKRFKKEFNKQLTRNKKLTYFVLIFGLLFMVLGFIQNLFLIIGVLIFILPYIYIYSKAVDESCMVKRIKTSQLTEGDWLYNDVKIGKKVIKASWSGLKKQEITLLRKKYSNILIKYGLPFSPVFLISFLIFIYIWGTGLWNSLW